MEGRATFRLQLVQHVNGQYLLLGTQTRATARHDVLEVLEDIHVGVERIDVHGQSAEGFFSGVAVCNVSVHVAAEFSCVDDRAD